MTLPFTIPSWAPKALLGLLIVAAVVALRLAGDKIDDLKAANKAQQQTIASLQSRVESDAALIAQRDSLIAAQNAGVQALADAATASRKDYEVRITVADTLAQANDQRAAELMKLTASDTDELQQCRQVRQLLIQELTQ